MLGAARFPSLEVVFYTQDVVPFLSPGHPAFSTFPGAGGLVVRSYLFLMQVVHVSSVPVRKDLPNTDSETELNITIRFFFQLPSQSLLRSDPQAVNRAGVQAAASRRVEAPRLVRPSLPATSGGVRASQTQGLGGLCPPVQPPDVWIYLFFFPVGQQVGETHSFIPYFRHFEKSVENC